MLLKDENTISTYIVYKYNSRECKLFKNEIIIRR